MKDLGSMKCVSEERIGDYLVRVHFRPDADIGLKYRPFLLDQVISQSHAFGALSRVLDMSHHHGHRGEYVHQAKHLVLRHTREYFVVYAPNAVRPGPMPEELHEHVKAVFKTALMVHNLPVWNEE